MEAPASPPSASDSQHHFPPSPLSQQQQKDDDAAAAAAAVSSTAALAKDAASFFHSRSFAECLNVLSPLLNKTDDDPKVLHNISVVEYLNGGCKEPYKLLDAFARVKKKTEDLARSANEQLDASTSGPKISNTPSGGNGILALGGSSSGSVTYMEGYDTSVSTLNTAIILYYLQKYAAALSVLEPLYRNIEPVDEHTALRVYLLMMDIHLTCRQPRKAAAVLSCMEKSFFPAVSGAIGETKGDAASAHPQQSEGVTVPNINTPSSPMPSVPTQNTDPSLTRTSSEEVLDEEALSLGLDIERSHAARSAAITPSSSRRLIEGPSATLKLLLHFYKVRLFLQTRNLKAAKREVKLATNLARGGDYMTALLLKAQLEYLRENHRKAVKLLTTTNKEPGVKCMVLNNLGCVYHQLRKHHVAAFYFQKALRSCESTATAGPVSCQDRSLGILYNAGIEQLSCGNPILAFSCFQEAGLLYYNQPLLWLRLAECCLVALEKGLLINSQHDLPDKKDDLKVCSIGEGKWQRIILLPGSANHVSTDLGVKIEDDECGELKLSASSESADFFVPGKSHQPSLALARMFLCNALYLLDHRAAEGVPVEAAEMKCDPLSQSMKMVDSRDSGTGETSQATSSVNELENKGNIANDLVNPSIVSYEDGKRKGETLLRQYILVDMTFIELYLENPLKAFKTAEILLQQPDCTQTSKFLGRIYAAEALCMLNRPAEASCQLTACLSDSSSFEGLMNGNDNDAHKFKDVGNTEASGEGDIGTVSSKGISRGQSRVWSTSSLTAPKARVCLYVNLAAVYAMQGDLEQAHHCAMQAVSIAPVNPVAVLSIVYVELLRGKTQEAVKMLKQYRHLFCRINNMNKAHS